jgi:hypothetical protein
MFVIDIPFKGCHGRSYRSSIVLCHILHTVSMRRASGVNDTACIMHAVSFFA